MNYTFLGYPVVVVDSAECYVCERTPFDGQSKVLMCQGHIDWWKSWLKAGADAD